MKVIYFLLSIAVIYAEPPVPSNQYLPSTQTFTSPSTVYGTPSSTYGTPGISTNYFAPGVTSASYGISSNKYGLPLFRDTSPTFTPNKEYGTPFAGSQYSTLKLNSQYSSSGVGSRYDISSQYDYPASISQYGTPRISSRYGIPRISSQYGIPRISSRYGIPRLGTQYGAPTIGSDYDTTRFGNKYLPPYSATYPRDGTYRDKYSEPANYNFKYDVQAPEYGTEFGHEEVRQGDEARGRYYTLLPDGRRQIVEYTADDDGYKPKISYEQATSGYGSRYHGFGGYAQGGYVSP